MTHQLRHWHPLAGLRHHTDRLTGDLTGAEPGAVVPMVDVLTEDGRLVLRADMPGVAAADVEIQVADDVLTVRGEHRASSETRPAHFIRHERRYGSFVRSLALPAGVDPDKIEATCRDGVVEVTVPLPPRGERNVVEVKPRAT